MELESDESSNIEDRRGGGGDLAVEDFAAAVSAAAVSVGPACRSRSAAGCSRAASG